MQVYRSTVYQLVRECCNKSIVLCGCNLYSVRLINKMKLLDLYVIGLLNLDNKSLLREFSGYMVYTLNDILSDFDSSKVVIIITNSEQATILEREGLRRNLDFKTLHCNISLRQEYSLDPTFGYNTVADKSTPGFRIFGNPNSKNKIFTIGNSTTDAFLFPFKSWSEVLYDKISKIDDDYCVYCGGVSGYMSPQEFLKLFRDIIPMEPCLVCCLEGFQDVHMRFRDKTFPFILKYQKEFYSHLDIDRQIDIYYTKGVSFGVDTVMSDYQLWKYNMRCMHAICQEFQIPFLGFLQPSIYNKTENPLPKDWEIILHYEMRDEYLQIFKEFFVERAADDWNEEYLVDLTHIFDTYDGLFIDGVHVCEKGNEVIAKSVFDSIEYILLKDR